MIDTAAAAEALQMAIYTKMPASKRIRQAITRSASLRKMVWHRVTEAHPGASAETLHHAFARRWLGAELADRVYGRARHR